MKIDLLISNKEHPFCPDLYEWRDRYCDQHDVNIIHRAAEAEGGDFLFLVSCIEIVDRMTRDRYQHALVIHASDLPKGRGMSPHLWQILEGKSEIVVSLLEANDQVDSGKIWFKKSIFFEGHELYDEINAKLFAAELFLMDFAIDHFNTVKAYDQSNGAPTYYPRRTPRDSELDPNKSLIENFDLLRIADPHRYPAYFNHKGFKYVLKIEKENRNRAESANIVFRVDASSAIGMGHLMRCLSLALHLRQCGLNPIFICREATDNGISLLLAKNFMVHLISGCNDAEETRNIIRGLSSISIVIVDHYGLDKDWEKRVGAEVRRIVVLDDLANRSHDCDLLIDFSLGRMDLDYQSKVSARSHLMLGPHYALLSKSYAEKRFLALSRRKATKNIERVLVTMGGSDVNNITAFALQNLEKVLPSLTVDVVVGSNYQHLDSLKLMATHSHHSVFIHKNLEDLSPLMVFADVAIGAGGVTSYERCCLGLPSLLLMIADNQYQNVTALHKQEAAIFLSEPDAISNTLMELIQNPSLWRRMSHSAADVCDGEGVSRVGAAIQSLL